MKKIISILLAGVLSSASLLAVAEDLAPDALIKTTVQEVLSIVKQDKDIQAGNQKKVLELVDAKVVPHFNFTRMTQLAVGKGWRTATPEQKQALTTEFRNMLVRTYTKAFTGYKDQAVEVKPAKIIAGEDELTVKTLISKPGAPSVTVDYEMQKTPNGWKVFDLTVEGISLVTSYRSSFADQVQQGGIDGLIQTLADKNKTAVNKAASK
jgi:phospholipid transport system substrate-binding protein